MWAGIENMFGKPMVSVWFSNNIPILFRFAMVWVWNGQYNAPILGLGAFARN